MRPVRRAPTIAPKSRDIDPIGENAAVDVTTALAITGAVTGVSTGAVTIRRAYRDRQQLRVQMSVRTVADGPPGIRIDVYNDSSMPATVREVGLIAKPIEFTIESSGENPAIVGEAQGGWTLIDRPILLGAYETRTFEGGVPAIDQFGIHADYPLRPYAADGRGRRFWGRATPVVRMVVGPNPPLEDLEPGLRGCSSRWTTRSILCRSRSAGKYGSPRTSVGRPPTVPPRLRAGRIGKAPTECSSVHARAPSRSYPA